MVTVDGFFAGPNGEVEWHNVDAEFNDYANEMLNSADTILFGRVTYQLLADYWPSPQAIKDDSIIANKMNNLPKIVFSKTLPSVEWQNTRLVKENIAGEISELKQQPGKDMVIFGSGSIVSAFMQFGLIDEYRIIVNPVVLGNGIPLFRNIKSRINLKLLKTKSFGSGNVILYYKP